MLMSVLIARGGSAAEPGLLFYLSGTHGTTADLAANGHTEPNFLKDVNPIADGARGPALRCEHTQRLAYAAPANIYAQRGTLSFFWRAREAVGPTEFPIFRVGYGDHSSWDMVWLRIDYNGHGFDAFVTDINLSRTRVSVKIEPFFKPDEWIHLALTWDETSGIRFFMNGKLAAEKRLEVPTRYDAQLDQFGPHSRIISPYQVQSDYNYVRGGDLDELRIYDRAVADADIATLAKGGALPALTPLPARSLADPVTRTEWSFRHGWNRPDDLPPALPEGKFVAVRKVEIHDAYDLKRWWWKANDGIRETTWPGVYNQSRLSGRNDYFKLPDWDCYSLSGKSVTFTLPDEPWNHLEISGAAWGEGKLVGKEKTSPLFKRSRGQERSIYAFKTATTGQKIQFDNVEQEQPIGEFAPYHVTAGREPEGTRILAYQITGHAAQQTGIPSLVEFVKGRHPSDEQAALVAEPADAKVKRGPKVLFAGLPLLHVFVPAPGEESGDDALDGIAVDLPAWSSPDSASPARAVSFNIRVKDPLWPARELLDFTFTADPREARTLWLDTRDRILPEGRGIYLTITASENPGNIAALTPSQVRLVFKSREAGRAEHELDRFTQLRDSYAMLVEENPRDRRYQLWARFENDLNDLLRVNPTHVLAQQYKADALPGSVKPPFEQPVAPDRVPLWAFRQVETLRRAKELVLWYIDHRQIENGELGGGLSDDTDMANYWPGIALMGAEPDKIADSLRRLLDACYAHGMFTDGLPTIQTDELHTYEEGINTLGQNLILDYGSPPQIERAMETARGLASITGVNAAGHRHIRSSYYSGTRMATEGVWGWSKAYSFLAFQPMQLLADYNGDPAAKKLLIELADGLLAHRKPGKDGRHAIPTAIHFESDAEADASRSFSSWALFWNAWQWTRDEKYLAPILDGGAASIGAVNPNALDLLALRESFGGEIARGNDFSARDVSRSGVPSQQSMHFAWQITGDKTHLEKLYAGLTERMANRWYINTEGSLWVDRINMSTSELQRARLGGVALARNAIFPGHVVSWRFAAPAKAESVAILIPEATDDAFKVIAYNLEAVPVAASMTGWAITPGDWEITQGVDADGDDQADGLMEKRTVPLERTKSVELTFPAHTTTVLTFKNVKRGTPYHERPDLGIDRQDVTLRDGKLAVNLHSLGSARVPASSVALVSADGKILAQMTTPEIAAPLDWKPKTAEVILSLPVGMKTEGCSVVIDPEHALTEITTRNNAVKL
ncbi:hypothetical protein CMV30_05270 [Nibricoccus aquaticus]|uniref:LamG-like jellyroll fold domain-containing protein n=2 Tax=Nibricoccus aquaticus TaxID=2576891 RepID=A0A290QC24_9BACT|nr:hypothetical protein CMV30_05270 [Nibricoccus aquaticus]